MALHITPGAISKILTGKCKETDMKPVVQVMDIHNHQELTTILNSDRVEEKWYKVLLSDGVFFLYGAMADGTIKSQKLQRGSIVRLTNFTYSIGLKFDTTIVIVSNVNVMYTNCDIIGNPRPFPCDEVPSIGKSTLSISDRGHVDPNHNEEDDMGACFKKLEKLGWATQGPFYDTAVLLFGESIDFRKVWLHLKPESCKNWVKNAGSKYGLLG